METINLYDYRGQSFKALCKTASSTADVFTLPAGHDPGHEATHTGDQIIYVIEGSGTARGARGEGEARAGLAAHRIEDQVLDDDTDRGQLTVELLRVGTQPDDVAVVVDVHRGNAGIEDTDFAVVPGNPCYGFLRTRVIERAERIGSR